jgi:hypothetical protein
MRQGPPARAAGDPPGATLWSLCGRYFECGEKLKVSQPSWDPDLGPGWALLASNTMSCFEQIGEKPLW